MAPGPREHGSDWPRTAKWIAIALIFVGAGIYVFKSCIELPGKVAVKSGEAVREVGRAVADVVTAFRQRTVITSFQSYATSITNQQYLQFATLKQLEIFTETDVQSLGVVDFEGVVEARTPVEYTYYVDLNGKWEFSLRDNVIYVQAPPIRANKPAADVSKLTYETKKYRPFLSAAAEKRLKQNLTVRECHFLQAGRESRSVVRPQGGQQEITELHLLPIYFGCNKIKSSRRFLPQAI